jgi:hypothetical protein
MAVRIRRMVVRDEADIAAAQTGVRTRAVKCRGATTVLWIGTATNGNALALVDPNLSQDPGFGAPSGNFRAVSAAADGTVAATFAGLGAMNTGGRLLAALHHEAGGTYPILAEQAELRFNSHATLTITGLKIEAIVIDEIGVDVSDSGPVNAT